MIFFKGWLGRPEAHLHDHVLDGERHRPGRALRQPRLPVQPEVQPLRRHQRQSRHAVAAGLAPVLAGPRPRDGRRVLPARLRRPASGRRASRCPASGTTPWSATTSARSASRRAQLDRDLRTGRVRLVDADDEGVRPDAAATATGSGTRSWRRASASRARCSPEQRFTNARHGRSGNTTLRLADSVNVFDTGALAPGVTVTERGLPASCRSTPAEVQGHLPADRDLQPLARRLRGRRPAAGRRRSTTRASTCRARSSRCRRSSSSTAPRRRSSATRTPASTTAPSTWRRHELLPVRHAQPPAQRPVHRREPLAGRAARSATTSAARTARRCRRRSRCSSEEAECRHDRA